MASKDGGPGYSAAELSDGERNALLIAGNVLTAPPGILLIIDEPERHLHRSIISPLLSQLFERRSDCGFVVSTHDHDLPLEVKGARTLLLRSCNFDGRNVRGWQADELPAETSIDDILKRDLLGARRKILFVEGTESSLDKPLYSLIFPMVSVIPKGNCRDVEQAVVGSRVGEGFHWLRAFGIADGDGYSPDQIEAKRQKGVYALPFYSVEAIYFHPHIISRIAARQADVSGDDPRTIAGRAVNAGVAAVAVHTDRLSQKAAKKAVRKLILDQLPNDDDLLDGQAISIVNDAKQFTRHERWSLTLRWQTATGKRYSPTVQFGNPRRWPTSQANSVSERSRTTRRRFAAYCHKTMLLWCSYAVSLVIFLINWIVEVSWKEGSGKGG